MAKVIVAHGEILSKNGDINIARLKNIVIKSLRSLFDNLALKEVLLQIFPRPGKVGVKINTIAGKKLSTRPEVALTLSQILAENHPGLSRIIIWDRTNRELKKAGYRLQQRGKIQVFGTDTKGVGYESKLTMTTNIGSLFSHIQSKFIHHSLSLAILKDHGLAGVTAGLKNYFGAIHNPNKYHDQNCDPFVAELCTTPPIKAKHRLTIIDALLVQFHRGPSYHPRWASRENKLIFSLDPVAADHVGWQIIDQLRRRAGLPSLAEENRPPRYLHTAEALGLGHTSTNMEILEVEG
ncbi:MAG TPA: DUF362 domain-containing protein [Candidatus Aminicenantes bacterium]|nr:DUF362 domain-containing protein [Candidatus Aminicenantes bacterium]